MFWIEITLFLFWSIMLVRDILCYFWLWGVRLYIPLHDSIKFVLCEAFHPVDALLVIMRIWMEISMFIFAWVCGCGILICAVSINNQLCCHIKLYFSNYFPLLNVMFIIFVTVMSGLVYQFIHHCMCVYGDRILVFDLMAF